MCYFWHIFCIYKYFFLYLFLKTLPSIIFWFIVLAQKSDHISHFLIETIISVLLVVPDLHVSNIQSWVSGCFSVSRDGRLICASSLIVIKIEVLFVYGSNLIFLDMRKLHFDHLSTEALFVQSVLAMAQKPCMQTKQPKTIEQPTSLMLRFSYATKEKSSLSWKTLWGRWNACLPVWQKEQGVLSFFSYDRPILYKARFLNQILSMHAAKFRVPY